MNSKLIEQAISMLEDTGIVPLDVIFRLVEMGVDFSVLEQKYSVLI